MQEKPRSITSTKHIEKRPIIQQNPHYNRDPYQYDSRNDPNNYPEYRQSEYPPYEYENIPHNPHPYPDQDRRTYYDRNYPPVRSNHLDPRINPNYRNVPPASDINSQPRRYGPVYPEKRADLNAYRQDPYPIGSQVFDQPIRMDYGNRNNPPDDEYQPDEIDNSYNPSENLYQKFDQIRKPAQVKVNPRVDEFLKAMEEFDAECINSNSMENSMQKRNLSREIRGKTEKTSDKNTYGSRTVKNPHATNGLMSMFDGPNLTKPKIPKPISRIPKMNFSKLSKPRNFVEELQKLEERQFGVKRTIEKLEIAQSRGRISESAYLEKYQNLQQLLYKTQKQIEDISKFI